MMASKFANIVFPEFNRLLTLLLLCWCLIFVSCNYPFFNKTDLSKTDSDTFTVSKQGDDSLEMRELVWREADGVCKGKNLYFMPVSKNYSQNHYEMKFRCLSSGDPELLEGETPYQEKRYQKKLGGYGQVEY